MNRNRTVLVTGKVLKYKVVDTPRLGGKVNQRIPGLDKTALSVGMILLDRSKRRSVQVAACMLHAFPTVLHVLSMVA